MAEEWRAGVLGEIVRDVRETLASRKRETPLAVLEARLKECGPPHDFAAALKLSPKVLGARWRIIAEIKRASPSRGTIRADLDPEAVARMYEANGAVAVSVLTEPRFFRGDVGFLSTVRRAVDLPVLRKDFIFDPYQVYEARAWGADAFLLIVAMLDSPLLEELIGLGRGLGMEALVEVHDQEELARALDVDCRVIGINNRNLADFTVDLNTTVELSRRIPGGKVVVSESGIKTQDDLLRLEREGVSAFLVGESLLSEGDVGENLRRLNGRGA
jgi:indole-3-glycerol phosphate synthase